MKIACVGAGPAGLYFAILWKKTNPSDEVIVLERNHAGASHGFGVVFSDSTLARLEAADPDTHRAIQEKFARWDELHIHHRGESVAAKGHVFAGICRSTLINLLAHRAREVGVEIRFDAEVKSLDQPELASADLIVAADGMNSAIRKLRADDFRATIEPCSNKYIWLGTTLPLSAFTFYFKEDAHGLWRVHAYPYDHDRATFIVECTADTAAKAGLESMSEAQSIAFLESLFAEELAGHRLIGDRSAWRNFPIIKTDSWSAGNIVLLGDAAHTIHFSIGSGTKVAMEDAIALAESLDRDRCVTRALARYECGRRPIVDRLQRAARQSSAWFEETEIYADLDPLELSMSLLCRSTRVSYGSLRERDPQLIERVDRTFAERAHRRLWLRPPPPPLRNRLKLRELELSNRIVEIVGSGAAAAGAGLVIVRSPMTVAGRFRTKVGIELSTPQRGELLACAARADRAGFDLLELDLSPEQLDELLPAVREVWPDYKPIAIRASADLSIERARVLKQAGADLVHVHADQTSSRLVELRLNGSLPVLISRARWSADEANTDLAAGRADLCGVLEPPCTMSFM